MVAETRAERAVPSTRPLRWEDRERFFALANRSELYTGEPCYGRELALGVKGDDSAQKIMSCGQLQRAHEIPSISRSGPLDLRPPKSERTSEGAEPGESLAYSSKTHVFNVFPFLTGNRAVVSANFPVPSRR